MKFFSRLFGKNTSFPKPKNNFEFIALNLALIYYVLNNSYKEYFDDEEQLLIASGVIDALVYIKDGTITLDDIRYAIRFARQGKCSLFLSEYMHEENVSEVGLFFGVNAVENLFLNFTLQIECLIFRVDTDIPHESIISIVISKKKKIKQIIEQTFLSAKNGNIDTNLIIPAQKIIQQFFTNPTFANLREQIGIKE